MWKLGWGMPNIPQPMCIIASRCMHIVISTVHNFGAFLVQNFHPIQIDVPKIKELKIQPFDVSTPSADPWALHPQPVVHGMFFLHSTVCCTYFDSKGSSKTGIFCLLEQCIHHFLSLHVYDFSLANYIRAHAFNFHMS